MNELNNKLNALLEDFGNVAIDKPVGLLDDSHKVNLKIVAWPYSRKLIQGFANKHKLANNVARLSKKKEVFYVDIDESAEQILLDAVRLIRLAAVRELPNSKARAAIRNKMVADFFGDEPEAKKPEAKKPEAKKPEAKKPEAKKPTCPKCSGPNVIKNGRKDDQQKYKCKDCATNFIK